MVFTRYFGNRIRYLRNIAEWCECILQLLRLDFWAKITYEYMIMFWKDEDKKKFIVN